MTHNTVTSYFELARDLMTARHPLEVAEMQADYIHQQTSALSDQIRDFQSLSRHVAINAAVPLKNHVFRSVKQLS